MASAANANANANASNADSKDCSICCDKFNMSTHTRIICEYGDCNYSEACKACVRTYLLNTASDPHCMNCKKAWSQKFLVDSLNKSYISSDYKKHKKQFLLEREISKLPETMEAAEKMLQIDIEEKKITVINAEMTHLKVLMTALIEKNNMCRNTIYHIKSGTSSSSNEKAERKTFIMPCPNNDCRGYLSSQYKCQLCHLQTCSKCHEIMGHSKEAEHTCKEENVQSAELIKKETKGCPSCGTRIFKINGCDQMWCTTCHKAFSWRTGNIETGVVHNPHFYEYQRQTNGGVAPRNPGDVACGGLCQYHEMNNGLIGKLYDDGNCTAIYIKMRKDIKKLYETTGHIIGHDMRIIRQKIVTLSDSEQIRIDYILKRISKEEMAIKIYRNNSLRHKYTEMMHIYELITVVGIDFFRNLINSTLTRVQFYNYVVDKLTEFNKLRVYCNDQFAIISNTYSQAVPQIDENFNISSKKLTIKKAKATATATGKATGNGNGNGNGKSKSLEEDDTISQSDTMSQMDETEFDDIDTPNVNLVVTM